MSEPTVNQPAAEREPDHVTPAGAYAPWGAYGSCPKCEARPGEPCELRYDGQFVAVERSAHTGRPLVEREPDGLTAEQIEMDRVATGLDDADDFFVIGEKSGWGDAEGDEDDPGFLMPAPGCGHPMPQGADCCIATPAPVEPERRTVSVEVLTDGLRAHLRGVSVGDEHVGLVLRVNGNVVAVAETDRTWAGPRRSPVDLLAALLRSARTFADDGEPRAELLMPTPDVLAALDGRPDAQLLTAPVWVLAMDVTPGMLLAPESAAPQRLVTGTPKCTDPDCVFGSCAVFVVDELPGELHQSGYARIRVRIPAAVTK